MSRILGFARDILIANILGATPLAEAFMVAFRLPNLFRRLFADGALLAAIVPVYNRVRHEQGAQMARQFSGVLFGWLLILCVMFSSILMLFMPQVVLGLAPGFADRPELLKTTAMLALFSFPYLGFMVLSSFQGGILNANGKFWAAAAAPILLNVMMIGALLLSEWQPELLESMGLSTAKLLVIAISLAGFLQLMSLTIACANQGLIDYCQLPRLSPEVKQFYKLMLPGIIGMGVLQINMVIATQIASTLDQGAIAYLYYADRLSQLPIGLIGVALGTALLPKLGKALLNKDQAAQDYNFSRALETGIILSFPAMIGLMILASPIINALFLHGAFTKADAAQTQNVTMMMALSVPPAIIIKICASVFFAHEDTKTPMRLAMLAVALNIPLAMLLGQFYGAAGIALSSSLVAWLSLCLYGFLLKRRRWIFVDQALRQKLAGILIANIAMAAGLWGLSWLVKDIMLSNIGQMIMLAVFILLALKLYFGLLISLKVINWSDALSLIKRR